MNDQVFMIDVVGSSEQAVRDATQRMIDSLPGIIELTGVMGPPTIRRNGAGREDDRTYRSMVVVTLPITETEEVQ